MRLVPLALILAGLVPATATLAAEASRPPAARAAGLTISMASLAAGRLVIKGTAASGGTTIRMVGTEFSTIADATRQFSFTLDHRTNNCRVTLVTNIGTQIVPIDHCGLRGSAGLDGPRGARGPKGPEGPDGPAGLRGPAGDRGPVGETGDRGPMGARGARGPRGASALSGGDVEVSQESITFLNCGTQTLSRTFTVTRPTRIFVDARVRFLPDAENGYSAQLTVELLDAATSTVVAYSEDFSTPSDPPDAGGYTELDASGVLREPEFTTDSRRVPATIPPGDYMLANALSSFGCGSDASTFFFNRRVSYMLLNGSD